MASGSVEPGLKLSSIPFRQEEAPWTNVHGASRSTWAALPAALGQAVRLRELLDAVVVAGCFGCYWKSRNFAALSFVTSSVPVSMKGSTGLPWTAFAAASTPRAAIFPGNCATVASIWPARMA